MTRIIFVRHGQTTWNLELKYQGHANIDLTPLGEEQAQRVAKRLSEENVAAVYASDLNRAYKTAEAIAAFHDLPVIAVPAMREISFGDWEGLTYEGIKAKWPELIDRFFSHSDEVVIPGGETFAQLKDRASAQIEQLVEQHEGQTIVVVSHGGTIRAILCAALHIHLNYVWNIRQDNTAVNIVEYHKDRSIVTLMNDSGHLK